MRRMRIVSDPLQLRTYDRASNMRTPRLRARFYDSCLACVMLVVDKFKS